MKRRRLGRLNAIESLCARLVLVPNVNLVTVAVLGTVAEITGSDQANAIIVEPTSGGRLRISGADINGGPTLINGKPFVEVADNLGLTVRLNGGDDRLWIRHTSTRTPVSIDRRLTVDAGAGNDSIDVFKAVIGGRVDVSLGPGTATGAENFGIGSSEMRELVVDAGNAGSSRVTVDASKIKRGVNIEGSALLSTVTMSNSTAGSFTYKSGDNNVKPMTRHTVQLHSTTVQNGVSISVQNVPGKAVIADLQANALDVVFSSRSGERVDVDRSTIRTVNINGGGGVNDTLAGGGNSFSTVKWLGFLTSNIKIRWTKFF